MSLRITSAVRKYHYVRSATLAIALAILPGCAVLTVDVDVYKGPLANHETTQTRQALYLVTTARPILGKLRYLLEREERDRLAAKTRIAAATSRPESKASKKRTADARFVDIDRIRDKTDFIAESDPDGHFASAEASRVNKIISNYSKDEGKEVAAYWDDTQVLTRLLPLQNHEHADQNLVGDSAGLAPIELATTTAAPSTRPATMPADIVSARSFGTSSSSRPDTGSEQAPAERIGNRDLGLEATVALYERAQSRLNAILSADSVDPTNRREALQSFSSYEEELRTKLYTFSQLLISTANNEVFLEKLDPRGAKPESARVANQILQALGNTILAQLDELAFRNAYVDRMKSTGAISSDQYNRLRNIESADFIPRMDRAIDSRIELLEGDLPRLREASHPAQLAIDGANYQKLLKDLEPIEAERQWTQDVQEVSTFRLSVSDLVALTQKEAVLGDIKFDDLPVIAATSSPKRLLAELMSSLTQPPEKAVIGQPRNKLWRTANAFASIVNKDDSLGPRNEKRGELANAFKSKDNQEIARAALAAEAKTAAEKATIAKRDLEAAQRTVTTRQTVIAAQAAKDIIEKFGPEIDEKEKELKAIMSVPERIAFVRQRIDGEATKVDPSAQIVAKELREALETVVSAASRQALAVSPTPVDTLERYVLEYEQRLIAEIEANGPTSPRAVRLRAAIEETRRQQAGFSYIRPAAAYLRTSFAANSLQRDASLGWHNFLLEQSLRGVPGLGKLYGNRGQKDLTTLLELDKQFWQNINTVRVAGGGNTNYVIAKDDIGNWYVKNYSADPEPIIKGARALLEFGAAGTADRALSKAVEAQAAAQIDSGKAQSAAEVKKQIDTVKAANDASGTAQPAAPGPDHQPSPNFAAESALLDRQAKASRAEYDKAALAALNAAIKSAGGLDSEVNKAWDSLLTDPTLRTSYKAYTDAPAKALAAAIEKAKPKTDDPAATQPADTSAVDQPDAIDGLRQITAAVHDYHDAVQKAAAAGTDAQKADATKKLTELARNAITPPIDQQTKAIADYAAVLDRLKQSAQPEP